MIEDAASRPNFERNEPAISRLASFNIENLFVRPRAMNGKTSEGARS